MTKPNFIFFDCESNSGRSHADILTISALFVASNFKLIDAPVTSLFLAGGGHNPASKSHLKEISDAISQWTITLT